VTDHLNTPLRQLPHETRDSVRVLRETDVAWLDGSEDELYSRITTCGLPLDSLSDDLLATAQTWPERYHLTPERANLLRALELPAQARVLEIGAGCGAITRYLGEHAAVVDALEPTFARARVAAARTADLPNVHVFCGEVCDIPDVAAYDVVVVVGVLEYVGGGQVDPAAYLEFLGTLRNALVDGGVLLLAIENALGAKYFAGAREDHSGVVFESVQGYPAPCPARTFSRRQLTDLVTRAGFPQVQVLGAFPDYKVTRAVFDDALFARAEQLAVDVPSFPSPDWGEARPALLDEALVWRQLVAAGLGEHTSNSFLVVASTDHAHGLWPRGRLGMFFATGRRRPFRVAKEIRDDDGAVTITSRLLGDGAADGLRVLTYCEPWVRGGQSLTARALACPQSLQTLVGDWRRALDSRVEQSTEGMPFDVLPHNLVYTHGAVTVIDDEWRSDTLTLRDVVLRGALLLVRDLTDAGPATLWGFADPWQMAQAVAQWAGVEATDDELHDAVQAEGTLQAGVGALGRDAESVAATATDVAARLLAALDAPRHGEVTPATWQRAVEYEAELINTRDLLFATGAQLDESRAEQVRLSREVAALRRRLGWFDGTNLVRGARRAAREVRARF